MPVKLKRFWPLFAACVFFLVPLFFEIGHSPSPEKQLDTFLQENHATAQEEEAYSFALHHPEVLEYIPCYCGCVRQGHKNNYNCFIKGNPQQRPQYPIFDRHGLVCPMCIQIALKSEKEFNAGDPLIQIRKDIDKMFEKYPKLKPTPTPMPPSSSTSPSQNH